MKVEVIFSEVSNEEQAHLDSRLADIKATHTPDDPLAQAASMEEVYALQIAAEVAAYTARDREQKVVAQRPLGDILVQLPDEDQAALREQLIERARAAGIDVSGLEAAPAG